MYRVIILLHLLSGLCATSQELSHRHYTVKDGLPGSVVYHTLQDRKGFIWFATNQGVSRFDGRSFKNFFKEDGLPDNEILKLYLDKHDNIWFISFSGIAAVLYKEKIYSFPACPGVFFIIEDFVTDSIYLYSHRNLTPPIGGYYKTYNQPGHWFFETHMTVTTVGSFLQQPVLKKSSEKKINFYFSLVDRDHYELLVKDSISVSHFRFPHIKEDIFLILYNIKTQYALSPDKKSVLFSADSLYFANKTGIRSLISMKELQLIESDLSDIYLESDSIVWLCTRTKGLIKIENFQQTDKRIHYYFSKAFCTSIIKDREGGYWITTHNDGIYYVPDANSWFLPALSDDNARELKVIISPDHETLLIGTAGGSIMMINSLSLKPFLFEKWNKLNKNNRILDIKPYGKDEYIIASDYGVYILSGNSKGRRIGTVDGAKAVCLLNDTSLLISFAAGIAKENIATGAFDRIFLERTTSIVKSHNAVYWGTLNGLYEYSDTHINYCGKRTPALRGTINHIDIAPDSAVWVSTQQGVVILKNNEITLIRKKDGLLSDMCKHVLFENNMAWISTDKGVSRVNYHWKNNKIVYTLIDITENDGLLSGDVNQCAIAGNYIWAATGLGISAFPKTYAGKLSLPPLINITRILAGNHEVAGDETISIDHRSNKLLVELSGISFRSGGQMRYAYRIKNIDSNWSVTSTDRLEFSILPFGTHVFEVRAIDRWGVKSEEIKRFIFTVTPPIWKTPWFIFLMYFVGALLTGLVVYLFYRNQQRKKDKEHRLEKKMYELEIMALKAQMNPHFIFNCLSSIQYYILRADTRNANLYLHKFSILIRSILDLSSTSDISLEEELKMLDSYLELEKLRMGDRMQYHIDVAEDIRPASIRIPSMIIQPYVENAIRHGISPLQDKSGMIRIAFSLSENYLVCTMEDNGIGIPASIDAKRSGSPRHPSRGTGITGSRINIINAIQKDKMRLEIINKSSGQGTLVQLSILL